MPSSPPPPDLRRVIGFWSGVAILIGCTIGSGIFRTPASIAGHLRDPRLILGLWTAFGIITLCGALALAELAAMLPQTGGIYVYLRAAYGDSAAFVFGWLYLLVTTPSSIGTLITFFSEQVIRLSHVVPPSGFDDERQALVQGVAISAIIALTVVNLLGVRLGTAIQNVFTSIKVGALAVLIASVFAFGRGDWGHLTAPSAAPADLPLLPGIAAAASSIIWTYDGWIGASLVAGEVIDPARRLARIICVGTLALVVLYLGANLAYFYMLPIEEMAGAKAGVAAKVISLAAGPWAGRIIGLCILASVFGAANGSILTRARVVYQQARDGLSFGFLARLHPRWGTPHVAILVQGAVAVLLVIFLRDFDALATYFVVVEWAALIFAVAGIFVLRRKMPDAPRPYRTPGYPWVPLVFIVGTAIGLAAIVWKEVWGQAEVNYSPLVGIGIALAGFPVYAVWKRVVRGTSRSS